MTDEESLWLVIGIIYLFECLVWLPRGAVAFPLRSVGSSPLRHPSSVAGNSRGGFFFAQLLPPFGAVLISRQFPISMSPEGFWSYSAASINPGWRPIQPALFVAPEEAHQFDPRGRTVRIQDRLFTRTGSFTRSTQLASLLRSIASISPKARTGAIRDAVTRGFDTKAVEERLAVWLAASKPIRPWATVLFFSLFLGAPALVWRLGFRDALPWLIPSLLVQTISIAWLFRQAHKRLYPAGADERFAAALTMALSAPTAVRAIDYLSRPLLDEFHPLATARVMCPPETFRRFAREVLLDLRFPLRPVCPTDDARLVRIEAEFRQDVLAAVEGLVEASGMPVKSLLEAPQPSEAANQAYCPRCEAQFVASGGVCGDCGGQPLVRFPTV